MINIDKSSMFGKGHHRECYIHPENQNLCIKIVVDNNLGARQKHREQKYYRHLEKRNISWDMIPRYHGEIITNFGVGSVFDLITDQDGGISRTLKHYISSNELTEENYNSLASLLYLLKNYLLEQRIITSPSPRNIVCQRNKSEISQLFIIDNIGNPHYIPISNYNKFLATRKINKEWGKFVYRMLHRNPDNKVLQRMFATSPLN